MSRVVRRGKSSPGGPGTKPAHAGSLDGGGLEAIQLFARALARCGASPSSMAAAFASACKRIPRSLLRQRKQPNRELADAAHIISLWFTDPLYLDSSGQPRPLTIRGKAPSFETLVSRVDAALDPQSVLKYLLLGKGLRKIGTRYVPKDRAINWRGTGGPTHSRSFRTLLALLRTLERNTQPESRVSGSFEFSAENPHFPLRSREDFGAKVRQGGLAFLGEMDSTMLGYERHRKPSEPTVRMGVGVYLFDDHVGAKPVRKVRLRRRPIRRRPPRPKRR